MEQIIQIEWAAAHLEEARKICKGLVEQKLVACAQIIPHMESIYFWKDHIESSLEVKVFLKTTESRYFQVEAMILQLSSYEVPEIIKSNVDGFDSYLKWICEVVN